MTKFLSESKNLEETIVYKVYAMKISSQKPFVEWCPHL